MLEVDRILQILFVLHFSGGSKAQNGEVASVSLCQVEATLDQGPGLLASQPSFFLCETTAILL